MKKFRCTPMTLGVPVILALGILEWIWIQYFYVKDEKMLPLTWGFISFALIMIACFLPATARRVEIYETKIVCKCLLPFQTYELEYSKCTVGLDYHITNNGKQWWIYLCYGPPKRFSSPTAFKRINAVKFRPGYIKMHYTDKVYEALLEVLPKNQRTALASSKDLMERSSKDNRPLHKTHRRKR